MLTKSCLAGITFFEMAAYISHLYSMIPGGYHGEKKSCEVFMHGIDLGHGLYLSHKGLGRESFHKRTCNFVQGGLHVKVSCAYRGNLPCVRHIFNCCKVPFVCRLNPFCKDIALHLTTGQSQSNKHQHTKSGMDAMGTGNNFSLSSNFPANHGG